MEDKIFYPHIITFRIINRKFLNEQCQFLGIFLFNRFCHSFVCSNLYIVIEAIGVVRNCQSKRGHSIVRCDYSLNTNSSL